MWWVFDLASKQEEAGGGDVLPPLSFAARFVGMDDICARALLWESEISLRPVGAVAVAVAA